MDAVVVPRAGADSDVEPLLPSLAILEESSSRGAIGRDRTVASVEGSPPAGQQDVRSVIVEESS